jgi:cell pole-organizing protein PopZ
MAQASSVQREPSMEEILASIRRIIEDSDTVRKGALEGDLAGDAEDRPVESAVIEVDAFRSELHAGRSAAADLSEREPEPSGAEPSRPVTLADVQARIAVEAPIEPDSGQADAAEPAALKEAVEAPPSGVAATPVSEEQEHEWSAQPSVAPVAAPEWTLPEDDHADAPRSDVGEPARVAPAPAAELHAPAEAEAQAVLRPTIISEQAGRQVAAAFGELSEAFAARSRKTFDDMAEQMMRPMLQDWLDNNLPTLVERLVREEIERVARGG